MTGQDYTKPIRRRWHRSTWVFVTLCAVVLLLLNVPAHEVHEFVVDNGGQYGPDFRNFGYHFEHGWPVAYLWQEPFVPSPPSGGLGWNQLPVSRWDFSTCVTRASWLGLTANVGGGVVTLAVFGMLFEIRRRHRQNIWQFTLQDLGLLVMLIAIPLGMVAAKLASHQRDVELVSSLRSGYVKKDGSPVFVGEHGIWQPQQPAWLSSLLGNRLDRIVQIDLDSQQLAEASQLTALQSLTLWGPVSNQQLQLLENYPRLEGLDFHWAGGPSNEPEQFDSEGFQIETKFRLPNLPRLRGLNMYETSFAGDGLEHLTALEVLCLMDTETDDRSIPSLLKMTDLRILWLDHTKVTSQGIRALSQLKRLEILWLGRTAADDDAVRTLLPLQKLRHLNLEWTEITDASVPVLKLFPALETLEVNKSKMTALGVAELQKALPNCYVVGP
ncbi:MAG: hypothetical protein K8R36_04225 [Planctomycetales bacterium]|nr:hypothetical protein [Planctomycetales bacterium]